VNASLSAWYPVKAIALSLAIALVVSTRWRHHHPFPLFGPANQITTLRALIVALIAAAIGGRHQRLAAWALGISGACFIAGTFFAILANKPVF
jgi:hypothetical protein